MYSAGGTDLGLTVQGVSRLFVESDGTLNVSGTTNYETLVTADDDIPNKKYVDDTNPLTGRWFLFPGGPSISGANFTGATTTFISTGRYRLTYPLGSNWTAVFQQEFNSANIYNIIIRVRSSSYLEIEIRDSATGALIAVNEAINFMIMTF